MVAITVLTVGFLGITTLLVKSFFLSRVTANDLTATYLASEGVEVAKNLLDHDLYSGAAWGTCGGDCTVAAGEYTLDYATGESGVDQLTSALCPGPYLYLDPTTNLYTDANYSGAEVKTAFQRCVKIVHDPSGSGQEVTVDSIVTWSTGVITSQNIDLQDHFYNWQ